MIGTAMITVIIGTTSTTGTTGTITILMNVKTVLGISIGSGATAHISTGIARLRGNGKLIGTGVTTTLMPYFR